MLHCQMWLVTPFSFCQMQLNTAAGLVFTGVRNRTNTFEGACMTCMSASRSMSEKVGHILRHRCEPGRLLLHSNFASHGTTQWLCLDSNECMNGRQNLDPTFSAHLRLLAHRTMTFNDTGNSKFLNRPIMSTTPSEKVWRPKNEAPVIAHAGTNMRRQLSFHPFHGILFPVASRHDIVAKLQL